MKSKKRLQRRFALLLSLMLGLSVLVVDRYNVTAIENEENQEQVTEEIMNNSETTQNQVQDAQDAVEQVDEDVKVEDESVNLSLRAEEVVVYVSNVVTDDQAPKGSAENPYSSLAEAVQAINTQEAMDAVIELMSDLTATECARINGKNITIHGNGHIITRGTEFASISDNARSWYNPAMIEVCNSSSSATASLYLESITLDDNGITAGTRYAQATTDGKGGNTDTVQDAIIATYDGVGTIILGNNTTLTGYAGMSAVRLSGGTLIMESGSLITGGKVFTTKGGGNGPAGAIWSQGGRITINNGASIDQIQGRAIYLDGQGSEAFVNGTISNVIANNNMWQGSDGTAMHIRNKSSVVLGETGHIHHVDGGSAVISVVQSSFEAKAGSLMSDTSNTQLMNINNHDGLTTNRVYLDGEVKDCTYGDVLFRAWYYRYEIGPNANIHNTTAKTKSIGMFYLQNGGELNVHGKIQDNNNTVVYMGNQGGSDTYVRVYDGGYIHGNNGYGIYANNSGQVEIYGGEISENSSYGVYVRAKNNWKNPTLKMTGGKIINNNSCGIYYITVADSPRSLIDITGGEISGNSSTYQVAISGANAKDAISRIYIKEGVVKAGNGKTDGIYTSFGTLSSIEQNGDLYLGNAKSEASNLLKELVKDYKEGNDDLNDYKTKGSALWFKAEADTLKFEVKPSSINVNLPLYVAYIPLKADGTPTDDAQVVILPVVNDAQVVIELKNLEPQQSYAMMWMQPSEKFGSIGITGDTEIYEELGVHHYNVDYKVTYSLSNDMKPLLSAGHEFTVDIQLDKRLAYDPQVGEITLPEKSVFEIVSTVYDQQAHSLKVGLKLKDGFTAYSKAELSFTASADFDEFVDAIFESDASLSSSLVLSGDSISTPFTLATVRPATTHFIPLFMHRVDYTGGSETVKEGTALSVDTDGGVMEIECPDKVMEDIVLPDPTKEGYVFVGWEVEREETSISFKALYHEIYTVTFVDYDDTVLAVVEVEAGNSAIAPENPIREGYRFVGWDTSFTSVQSDLTVKALYHQLFTVTFVDYDDTVLAVVEVEAGHAAIAPQNPTREGYAFVRWDRNFTNVQSDLVVHALYERIPVFYTVSFVDYDGSILDQQLIEEGHKAVAPNDPTREGYTFIGWDVAFDDVQSDLTVTAMYEEVEAPVVIVDPETPQTPQQPTPTPTPTPQPEIPEPVIPLVPVTPEPEPEPEPTPGPVELPDPDTPLSPSEGNWALINLAAALISLLFGLFTLLNKKQDDQDQEKENGISKVLGVLFAAAAVVVFILTEDMSMPMVMVDKWSVVMVILAAANIVIFGISRKKEHDDQTYQSA